MFEPPRHTRIRLRRNPLAPSAMLVVLTLLLAACGSAARPGPVTSVTATTTAGTERIRNGGFEQGAEGWTVSAAETEGVEVVQPVVNAESQHSGANGVRFATQPETTAISAYEQEFAPTQNFTFEFWVRPQQGSNRIGLAADGRRGNVNVSRLVFLNAGESGSQIIFTAWDVNHVFTYPLDIGTWLHIRIAVDGTTGAQTLHVGDGYTATVAAGQQNRPAARAIFLGDRQPRLEAYTIPNTNARVTNGLNGTYDFDDISVIGP